MPKHAQFSYNPALKARARELRKHSTLGEVLLWEQLKRGQRCGYDFHRQKPVDEFILDFFCPELLLAVEIDGGSHRVKGINDENRQKKLESLGIHFLRFAEKAVRQNLDGVVGAIDHWIVAHRQHTPPLRGTPLERGSPAPRASGDANESCTP